MKNFFLEKSYTKCRRETSARRFSGKLKLSISLDQYSKVLYSLFLLYPKLKAIEIYWNSAADHLILLHIKHFLKIKRGLELVSLPYFLHSFSFYILLIHQVSFREILLGNMYCNYFLTRLWRHEFWNELGLLIKAFLQHD